MYSPLLRLLFFSGVIFTTFFLATQLPTIRIDTDLKDLSPEYLHDRDTAAAADKLSADIQKRMLWLIRGKDVSQVEQAKTLALNNLAKINSVTLTPDLFTFSDEIVGELLPYRFQLLSDSQQQKLLNETTESIAKQAHAALYQLDASMRLTPFDRDPLAWFNDYLVTQLSKKNLDNDPSKNRQTAQIISLNLAEGTMELRQQRLLSDQLDTLQAQIIKQYDVEVLRSGLFFFANDAATKSKHDISLISTISMLGVSVLLLIAFRSLWPLVLPFASIALGVGFALSVVHSLYGSIHVLTIVFGASLIGIVIDYSLHYFYHLSDQSSQLRNNNYQALHKALLLSLATSLIGYGALGLSGLQALQKVAVFSCCGLSMAWLCVICLGPFTTAKGISSDKKILPKLLQSLLVPIHYLHRYKTQVFILILSAAVLSTVLGHIKTSDDPRLFFNASADLLAEEKIVRQYASEYEPGRYLMISGKDAIQTQLRAAHFFQAVEQTTSLSRNQFNSVFDWVPTPIQQRNNYQRQKRLYDSSGATKLLVNTLGLDSTLSESIKNEYQNSTEQVLTPNFIASILNNILPPFWFESAQQKIGLILINKGTDLNSIEKISQSIEGVDYINTIAATTTALSQQRRSATQLLILAYLFVAVLIFIRYRTWRSTRLLLIPMTASISFILLFSWTGQTITLFHTMALFLVLGLGMDYAIFAHDMQDNIDKTRQAILVSAITSLLSFGLLGLSEIPVIKAFGLTLLIGNSINLIGALSYSLNKQKLA